MHLEGRTPRRPVTFGFVPQCPTLRHPLAPRSETAFNPDDNNALIHPYAETLPVIAFFSIVGTQAPVGDIICSGGQSLIGHSGKRAGRISIGGTCGIRHPMDRDGAITITRIIHRGGGCRYWPDTRRAGYNTGRGPSGNGGYIRRESSSGMDTCR